MNDKFSEKEEKEKNYEKKLWMGQTVPEKELFKIKNRREFACNRIWAFAIDLRRISSMVISWEIS